MTAIKARDSIKSVRDEPKRSAIIEAIDAVPEGIFENSKDDFEAAATVCVTSTTAIDMTTAQ